MDPTILAENIRRLRTAKKLSQIRLAEAAGISTAAIKNLERCKSVPRMRTLQAIAGALDVKIHHLFRPVRQLQTVRFRSKKRLRCRENVLVQIARWLDDFNYLEDILNEKRPFVLRSLVGAHLREDVIDAAGKCRKALGLKASEPIYDICGVLEHAGVKMLPIPMASDAFFGVSVGEEDGGPAVVVNIWDRISVERQIFSAAHELGHLLLHPDAFDVSRVDENEHEEKEANHFAGHFLMPDNGFKNEWNEAAGLHLVDRVFKVKRIFRVSYKTVLARLLEHEAVDDGIWKKFNIAYRKRYNKKLTFKKEPMALPSAEPVGMQRVDFQEDRFSRLARIAVEKDKISFSRGAEMLNCTVKEMQDLLANWEPTL